MNLRDIRSLKWLRISKENIFIWINSLVMITGLLFFHWSAEIVVVSYFFETIVIGAMSIVKIYFTAIYTREAPKMNSRHKYLDLVYIPFFLFVYAFAIFIQSVFAFVFLQMHQPAIDNPFNVWDNYMYYVTQPETIWVYGSIVLMNMGGTVTQFFMENRFRSENLDSVAMEPFERIKIQQITVIVAGYILMTFQFSSYIAVVFVIVNFISDLILVMKKKETMEKPGVSVDEWMISSRKRKH